MLFVVAHYCICIIINIMFTYGRKMIVKILSGENITIIRIMELFYFRNTSEND